VAKTSTYDHDYAQSNGFLTLLSDGKQLTGAYALGPEAGEWLQQPRWAFGPRCRSTCCGTPSSLPDLLGDFVATLKALHKEIGKGRQPG